MPKAKIVLEQRKRLRYRGGMNKTYSVLRFTEDEVANAAIIAGLDYHTLCVIQDATGYTPSGRTMMLWVKSGESFSIDPHWPCCKGRAWYSEQSQLVAA